MSEKSMRVTLSRDVSLRYYVRWTNIFHFTVFVILKVNFQDPQINTGSLKFPPLLFH